MKVAPQMWELCRLALKDGGNWAGGPLKDADDGILPIRTSACSNEECVNGLAGTGW